MQRLEERSKYGVLIVAKSASVHHKTGNACFRGCLISGLFDFEAVPQNAPLRAPLRALFVQASERLRRVFFRDCAVEIGSSLEIAGVLGGPSAGGVRSASGCGETAPRLRGGRSRRENC